MAATGSAQGFGEGKFYPLASAERGALMPAQPKTVKEYLATLPEDRRRALETVRKVIRKNLPSGYTEGIMYGIIGYSVPLSIYPPGYHCQKGQPLPYAALASRKGYMTLYLCNLYMDRSTRDWFFKACKAAGKKLDFGKSCIRFKKAEDLPLDVIGQAVARTPVKDLIRFYEQARPRR